MSAECERVFSSCGLLLEPRRNRDRRSRSGYHSGSEAGVDTAVDTEFGAVGEEEVPVAVEELLEPAIKVSEEAMMEAKLEERAQVAVEIMVDAGLGL